MRSFLKLFGPDLLNSIPLLTSIALQFNKISGGTSFRESTSAKTLNKFIQSFTTRGHYDYVYDWHEKPTIDDILLLIKLLDEQLKSLKLRYQITTMEGYSEKPIMIESSFKVSYIKILGPGIYQTFIALENFSNQNITSHGISEGMSDYYFEWNKDPEPEDIKELINQIDQILPSEYDVYYRIQTLDPLFFNQKVLEAQAYLLYSHPYL
ncbi:MAG: hypothetical protein ACXAC7_22810 [Candidatus Hodarchaeales archaeon]|jgi:hypothetical protein